MINDGSEKFEKTFFADSMGYLGFPDEQIVVEDNLKLNLVHLTAVPSWVTTIREALLEIERFKKMIQVQPRLKLVTNQKELLKAVADKKIAVILGMQNMPDDIGVFESAVSMLKNAGIGVIAPCHDKQNRLGSGCLNTDIGLTKEGERFLNDCGENGVIVNIAGCGHKMARDIISRLKTGVKFNLMISHTGCYSLYHHLRNLPDDVLVGVAELKGIIGISTINYINDERDNGVYGFQNHMDRARVLCGEKSVCVGSGNTYITRSPEEDMKQFKRTHLTMDSDKTLGVRFPINPLPIMGPQMMDILCKFSFPHLPNDVWEGVFGENLLNFFKKALLP